MRVEDHRSGASTVLEILEADFGALHEADAFTPARLRRGLPCRP